MPPTLRSLLSLALVSTGLAAAGAASPEQEGPPAAEQEAVPAAPSRPAGLWPAAGAEVLEHLDLIQEGQRRNLEGDLEAADRIWTRLHQRDPGHPAAPVFRVNTLYWRQMHDETNTAFDAAILAGCEEGMALARARLDRDPDDVEGHFYLGQALMLRGRLQGVRGHYLSAGSNGERAREHLERAIALRPDLVDARHQLGLYYYYASLLPRLVSRWLGWLWFVPSGDGPTGLRYLREVAAQGQVYRDEATFLLANIYTYHETDHLAEALRMVRELHARYPRNLLIHFEVLEANFEAADYSEVIRVARQLEEFPARNGLERGRVEMARVWRSRAELLRGRPEAAWKALEGFAEGDPSSPNWGSAWVDLTRAQILDVQQRRAEARRQYRRVLAYRPPRGSDRAEELAHEGLATPFTLGRRPSVRAVP